MVVKCRSNEHIDGFNATSKSRKLNGKPCLMEHCAGKGPAMWPLICTKEKTLPYIAFMSLINFRLYP